MNWKDETMKEEVTEININKIKPNKFFKRSFSEEELREMAKTIKVQGIINLIEIDENNVIITGGLRWRATKLLGRKMIKVKRITGLTEFEKMCRCFIENRHRKNLSYAEEIDAIKKLFKHLKSFCKRKGKRGPIPFQGNLAKILGVSESWLSQILSIERKGIEELKTKAKEGKLSTMEAIEIAKLPEMTQKEILEQIPKNKIEESRPNRTIRLSTVQEANHFKRLMFWLEKGKVVFDIEINGLNPNETFLIKKYFDDYLLPFYKELCDKNVGVEIQTAKLG